MNGRMTAEIVADLRDASGRFVKTAPHSTMLREAADRLAELDAEVKAEREARYGWSRRAIESEAAMFNQKHELGALRPTCPTCDGCRHICTDGVTTIPCPENGGNCDGQVSWEWMTKVFDAVHDTLPYDKAALWYELRAVRA